MIARAKASELSAAIDWCSYGATPFQADRIQRAIALIDLNGPQDVVQLASKLPVNPRTKKPVDPRTVAEWLRPAVAEGVLIPSRRYLGRPRNGDKSCRDRDLISCDEDRLRSMRKPVARATKSKGKLALFDAVAWPSLGITWEQGANIFRVCESVHCNPKMTNENRARAIGIGKSTVKKLMKICEPRDKAVPKNEIRLGIIEAERQKDTWPRESSIRRIVWTKVELLPRVKEAAPQPNLLRTLPVAVRPIDGNMNAGGIAKGRDYLAVDGIETVDQANAAERILMVIDREWTEGVHALSARLNIQRSTLEKHLARLRRAGLIDAPAHRKGLKFKPITVNRPNVEAVPMLRAKPRRKRREQVEPKAGISTTTRTSPKGRLKLAERRGGRKAQWDNICGFALEHMSQNPMAAWRDCIFAYVQQNPGATTPTPQQLRAAMPKYKNRHGIA